MQTLGLASEQKPSDGMFKRLFWPTIENQYDVDLVGQQGFWVCVVVGAFPLILMLLTSIFGGPLALGGPLASVIALCFGLFSAVTYFLAGVGVRERSVVAALLIFLCYLMDRAFSMTMIVMKYAWAFALSIPTLGFIVLGVVGLMLLLANLRATILSRKWQGTGTPEDIAEMPARSTVTLADEIANSMPSVVWPWGRYLFFPMAGLLLLTLIATVATPFVLSRRAAELAHQRRQKIHATQNSHQ